MIDEEEVRTTTQFLPRLIRIIYYSLNIMTETFFDRHYAWCREQFPSMGPKEYRVRSSSDRQVLLDRNKLSFNKFQHLLVATGYDIECVSVRIRDRRTGELHIFSTDMTVDEINERLQKEQDIGLNSLG